MIDNLDELIEFTRQQAEQDPDLADGIILKRPGLTDEEVVSLQSSAPHLPESYKEVAKNVRLEGVSIGSLALWPRPFGNNLVEAIERANSSAKNPYLPYYESRGLVEVARLESDPICLVCVGHDKEGQVVWFDASSSPEVQLSPVAPDYESMMLLMGNVLQVGIMYEEQPEKGENLYEQWLERQRLEDGMASFWRNQLRELLIE